jgi:hypothetical protein
MYMFNHQGSFANEDNKNQDEGSRYRDRSDVTVVMMQERTSECFPFSRCPLLSLAAPSLRLCPRPRSNRINHKVTKQRYILQAIKVSRYLCITRSLLVVHAVEARQDELFPPIQEPRRQSSLAYLSTSETRSHKQADIRITISCSLSLLGHTLGYWTRRLSGLNRSDCRDYQRLGHITPEYVLFPDPRLYLATLKQASSPLSLSSSIVFTLFDRANTGRSESSSPP